MLNERNFFDCLIKLLKEESKVFDLLDCNNNYPKNCVNQKTLRLVEEIYFLFWKLKNKDKLVEEIIKDLDAVRSFEKLDTAEKLKNNLKKFLDNQKDYCISF